MDFLPEITRTASVFTTLHSPSPSPLHPAAELADHPPPAPPASAPCVAEPVPAWLRSQIWQAELREARALAAGHPGELSPGDTTLAPTPSPRGWARARAAAAVLSACVSSAASTREDVLFGDALQRSEELRRDAVAEAQGGQAGARKGWGKRKRSSVAWVGEMRKKVARGLAALPFRRSRKSSSRSRGSPTGPVIEGVEVEVEDSPIRSGSSDSQSETIYDAHVSHIEDIDEGFDADFPWPPPRPSFSHSSYDSGPRSSPARLTRGSFSPSSAYALSSPHPDYESDGSYIDALTTRLLERQNRGDFDEDVLSFRFAGAAGNQEDGVESLFYAELRSDVGSEVGRRNSEEVLMEEIRLWGPEWARRDWFGEER